MNENTLKARVSRLEQENARLRADLDRARAMLQVPFGRRSTQDQRAMNLYDALYDFLGLGGPK